MIIFSLCFSPNCRDWSKSPTATIDFHLGELFYTLEGGMAKTHNITKTLGIKDGKFGPSGELSEVLRNPETFLFSLICAVSFWTTWRCWVLWEDPLSYQSRRRWGRKYIMFMFIIKNARWYLLHILTVLYCRGII